MTDPQTLCRTCMTPISYIDAPTGGWWVHETHPADEHDAVPGGWVDGDELMEAIAAEVWEHCAGEATRLVVDDPRNIAGTAAAVARRLRAVPSVAAGRSAKAEALLLHFTAEAHRRKWAYDRGLDDDGVPLKSEAFDALHQLGDEMSAALHKLRRMADEAQQPEARTPCSEPNGCDPDGDLCDQHETELAHAEGEHAFCGVTCEVEFPTEMLRNGILAKGYPGTAGMLDELLRRAATEPKAAVAESGKEA